MLVFLLLLLIVAVVVLLFVPQLHRFQLYQCYPTTPLRPSPEELRELFRATSAG